MKLIALIWTVLVFAGSFHSCIAELAYVRTSGGAYISVFQEDCHSEDSTCHKKTKNESNDDSNCCDFGICSCTLTYISDYQDIELANNIPDFYNSDIFYNVFYLFSSFTGDIFEPPQTA